MPFVGAIIVPHSPLLLPTVGKEYASQTKKTQKALTTAIAELYAMQPDTLLIIHPHGPHDDRANTFNVSPDYTATFAQFGDLVTTAAFRGETTLVHELSDRSARAGLPTRLTHEPNISYDAAVPLLGLPEPLRTSVSILPMTPGNLDARFHVDFGRLIAEALHQASPRVAVIASAELSQHASSVAASGYRPEGESFDTAVVKSLGQKAFDQKLLAIDNEVLERVEACGYSTLLTLSGLLAKKNCHIRKLSYEHPFGIGFLTAVIHPA